MPCRRRATPVLLAQKTFSQCRLSESHLASWSADRLLMIVLICVNASNPGSLVVQPTGFTHDGVDTTCQHDAHEGSNFICLTHSAVSRDVQPGNFKLTISFALNLMSVMIIAYSCKYLQRISRPACSSSHTRPYSKTQDKPNLRCASLARPGHPNIIAVILQLHHEEEARQPGQVVQLGPRHSSRFSNPSCHRPVCHMRRKRLRRGQP